MNYDELQKALKQAEEICATTKAKLIKGYVSENAKAKIGDIVTDSRTIIVVKNIVYSTFYGKISIYYKGEMLKKNLTKYKTEKEGMVSEGNINFYIIKKNE